MFHFVLVQHRAEALQLLDTQDPIFGFTTGNFDPMRRVPALRGETALLCPGKDATQQPNGPSCCPCTPGHDGAAAWFGLDNGGRLSAGNRVGHMLNVNSPQFPCRNSADQWHDVPGNPSCINVERCRTLYFPKTCHDEPRASGIHVLAAELFHRKGSPQFPFFALRVSTIRGGADDNRGAFASLLYGERTEGTDFDTPLRAANADLGNEDLAPTGIDTRPKAGQGTTP